MIQIPKFKIPKIQLPQMPQLQTLFKKRDPDTALLRAENIYLKFGSRPILQDANFMLQKGSITVITGKSGCGKTTLLGIISGLLRPNKGRVYYKGRNMMFWGDIRKSLFRNNRIGFVFQFFNLLSDYTAFENIILPATFNPFRLGITKRAREMVEYLGLKKIRNQYPDTLSGGERQRVAVARAIINNPDIILADEPTGNLDDESAIDIRNLFLKLRDEGGKTLIIVTHDHRIVSIADQHLHLDNAILREVTHEEWLAFIGGSMGPGIEIVEKTVKAAKNKITSGARAGNVKKSVKSSSVVSKMPKKASAKESVKKAVTKAKTSGGGVKKTTKKKVRK